MGNLRSERDPASAGQATRLPDEDELLATASDPLALRALEMMRSGPVSAGEVAKAVRQPVEEVRLRLDELRRLGLLALEETREVEDGAEEPFYHGPFVPFIDREEREELDPKLNRFHEQLVVHLLTADLEQALEGGSLDAWPDFHLCRMPFRIDKRGLDEIRELFDHALMESVRIRAEAERRVRQNNEEGIRGVAATLLFELPERE